MQTAMPAPPAPTQMTINLFAKKIVRDWFVELFVKDPFLLHDGLTLRADGLLRWGIWKGKHFSA